MKKSISKFANKEVKNAKDIKGGAFDKNGRRAKIKRRIR